MIDEKKRTLTGKVLTIKLAKNALEGSVSRAFNDFHGETGLVIDAVNVAQVRERTGEIVSHCVQIRTGNHE